MRYLFEVENKDSRGREMPETDLTVFDSEHEAVEYYFNWYRKHGYPMVDISDYDPRQELAELVAFDETTIEHNGVLAQSMVGCGFLWAFFPHWIDVPTFNDGSLAENWKNDKKLRELVRKTYRFCMLHEGADRTQRSIAPSRASAISVLAWQNTSTKHLVIVGVYMTPAVVGEGV